MANKMAQYPKMESLGSIGSIMNNNSLLFSATWLSSLLSLSSFAGVLLATDLGSNGEENLTYHVVPLFNPYI